MFAIDSARTHLAVGREHILALVASINGVAVKVPGIQAGSAMATIAAFEVGRGQVSVVIYLYYAAANRAVFYVPEPRELERGQLPQVMDEAREFLESMGFMLDEVPFAGLDPAAQTALCERMPLFSQDLAKFAASRDAVEVNAADLVEVSAVTAPAVTGTPAAVRPVAGVAPTPTPSADRGPDIGRLLSSF
ncbi:MAG: hypothetical protein HY903_24845 [Deltaproteobacteria bacterium]|nr:hypothetical protein [Deltaproteobacteria bacterium]